MSRRLEILRAQHAARPEWMKTDNPLVERHRDTGVLRAIGLTVVHSPVIVTGSSAVEYLPTSDGWIEFTCTADSVCPVPPTTQVQYRMRNGESDLMVTTQAANLRWNNKHLAPSPFDIIAYRVVPTNAAKPSNRNTSKLVYTGWIYHNPDTYRGERAPASGIKWVKCRTGLVMQIPSSYDIDRSNLWRSEPHAPNFGGDIVAYCLHDKCPE